MDNSSVLSTLVALTDSENWWLTACNWRSYTSSLATFEVISISIVFVWTSVGFTRSNSISFADTYELPVPESISARHLIPLTLITITGNRPSPVWFAVKATPLAGVG